MYKTVIALGSTLESTLEKQLLSFIIFDTQQKVNKSIISQKSIISSSFRHLTLSNYLLILT
jgi:hypothetical protein